MKKTNFSTGSIDELRKLLNEAQKSLFDLKVDNNLRKLKNFKTINLKRKEIASIKTHIRNKELKTNAG